MPNEFEQHALYAAEASPCEKRRVGATFVHNTVILTSGYNYEVNGESCEHADGTTKDSVKHAEVVALDALTENQKQALIPNDTYMLYVTHAPCDACETYIKSFARRFNIIITVSVVDKFMKFDSGKLNYDLVPSAWLELDAEVLTKGAQKYKPNNWKEIKPEEIMRYYSAAMRHILEWKKFMDKHPDGHLMDDGEMGIGTHHLANARTNLGFLLTLTETEEKANELRTNR